MASSTSVVKPRDVGETHVGGFQNGLKIVVGERHLAPHISGVLRIAFGIDRSLTRADQLPANAFKYFGLVVAKI